MPIAVDGFRSHVDVSAPTLWIIFLGGLLIDD
jgi:hypothetical protein